MKQYVEYAAIYCAPLVQREPKRDSYTSYICMCLCKYGELHTHLHISQLQPIYILSLSLFSFQSLLSFFYLYFLSSKYWQWSICNLAVHFLHAYSDLLFSLLLFSIFPFLCFPFVSYFTYSLFYSINWRSFPHHPNTSHSSLEDAVHIVPTLWFWVMVLHEVGLGKQMNHSVTYSTGRQVRRRQLQQ